jgi:hypothetical protein
MTEKWISDAANEALWFSAKLRFELSRQSSGEHQYEDRIYLFHASDQESAETRAAELGYLHEHEYKTDAGDVHKWRFIEVLRVVMTFLDTPLDRGIEVYSERVSK